MYLRCKRCHGCTRLKLSEHTNVVRCPDCGQRAHLDRLATLGPTPYDRSRLAQECASSHGIDLASAYALLLGTMSLDECRQFSQSTPRTITDRAIASSADTASDPAEGHYDPGFANAIAEGFLTAKQAVDRGDRVVLASELARKYKLEMHTAFNVADNRVTIAEIHKQRRARPQQVIASGPAKARERDSRLTVTLLSLIVVAALIGGTKQASTSPEAKRVARASAMPTRRPAAPSLTATATIRQNATGEFTKVVGSSPRSVLDTFCQAKNNRSALRLEPAPSAWKGVYRQGGAIYAIEISQDSRDGQWSAGNGEKPIAYQRLP